MEIGVELERQQNDVSAADLINGDAVRDWKWSVEDALAAD